MFTSNATLPTGRSPFTPPNFTNPSNSPGLPRDYDSSTFISNPSGAIPSVFTAVQPDRPFLSLATGYLQTGTPGTQFPNSRGIDDTLLRSHLATGKVGRLLQKSTDYSGTSTVHPNIQYQLLNKIFNNVTTRSNVFAVWLTVGFFEVTDDTTTPPTLGAEVFRSEGRNVRHRMFAIIDRTNLAAFQTTVNTGGITASTTAQALNLASTSYTDTRTGRAVTLPTAGGFVLTYEPGTDNEEDVIVMNVNGTGNQATFQKPHAAGAPVILRGNPGPWTRYDMRQDPFVVLYWNVIN
jgi:hypothetical protein